MGVFHIFKIMQMVYLVQVFSLIEALVLFLIK